MPARPCPSEACQFAVDAQESAHAAIETAGGALAESAQAKSVAQQVQHHAVHQDAILQRLDRRTRWQPLLQWAVPVLVTAVGIYVGYTASTQESRVAEAAVSRTEAMVDSKLRQHLESQRQSNLDTAREALRLELEERKRAENPAPIAKSPDKLAAKSR